MYAANLAIFLIWCVADEAELTLLVSGGGERTSRHESAVRFRLAAPHVRGATIKGSNLLQAMT